MDGVLNVPFGCDFFGSFAVYLLLQYKNYGADDMVNDAQTLPEKVICIVPSLAAAAACTKAFEVLGIKSPTIVPLSGINLDESYLNGDDVDFDAVSGTAVGSIRPSSDIKITSMMYEIVRQNSSSLSPASIMQYVADFRAIWLAMLQSKVDFEWLLSRLEAFELNLPLLRLKSVQKFIQIYTQWRELSAKKSIFSRVELEQIVAEKLIKTIENVAGGRQIYVLDMLGTSRLQVLACQISKKIPGSYVVMHGLENRVLIAKKNTNKTA